MKHYLDYLLHDMLPSLYKGIIRFLSETFTFIKNHALWICVIIIVLYLADIGGTRRIVDDFFHFFKHKLFR